MGSGDPLSSPMPDFPGTPDVEVLDGPGLNLLIILETMEYLKLDIGEVGLKNALSGTSLQSKN